MNMTHSKQKKKKNGKVCIIRTINNCLRGLKKSCDKKNPLFFYICQLFVNVYVDCRYVFKKKKIFYNSLAALLTS